jgi:hypothetical protein
MTPSEVNRSNEDAVLSSHSFQTVDEQKSTVKFQVGDRVRITSYMYTFSNKYGSNWTRDIFVITTISNTRPVTYKIKYLNEEEIVGTFYNEELQETSF